MVSLAENSPVLKQKGLCWYCLSGTMKYNLRISSLGNRSVYLKACQMLKDCTTVCNNKAFNNSERLSRQQLSLRYEDHEGNIAFLNYQESEIARIFDIAVP